MADLIENCRRHRGMIGLLTVLGALLLGARAQQQGLVGSDVTLVPKYTGDLKEIKWELNNRIFVEIILKPREEIIYPLLNDRITINKTNGALTIRYLTTGDSGVYKVKVILMNNSIQETEIRLTVHDCPDQPTISVQSTKDQFVVSCKSFSPDVTYEWFNPTTSVSKSPLYTVPKKNGTLTCVVDNEVCNKRSSINFYTPEEKSVGYDVTLVPKYTGDPSEIIWKVDGYKLVKMVLKPQVDRKFYRLEDRATISHTDGSLTIWELTIWDSGNYTAVVLVNNDYYYTEIRLNYAAETAVIVIWVVTAITILIHLLWWCCCSCRKYSRRSGWIIALIVIGGLCIIHIVNFILLLCYFYYKKSIGQSRGDIALIVVVGGLLTITIILCYCFYKNTKKASAQNKRIKDSNIEGAEGQNTVGNTKQPLIEEGLAAGSVPGRESEKCITVEFKNDYTSPSDESRGLLEDRLLTIHDVLAVDDVKFTAEAVMFDKKKGDGKKNKKKESDPRIHVKELVWKENGVTMFKWANSSLKFHTSNIKLEPKSVTVYNAEGKESYKVKFQLEGEAYVDYLNLYRRCLRRVCQSSTINCNGHSPDGCWLTRNLCTFEHPVTMSITFHPSKMTDIDLDNWKKNGQPLNTDGGRITCKPNGDLTINKATSKDKGTYTVQCKDEKQEFILQL